MSCVLTSREAACNEMLVCVGVVEDGIDGGWISVCVVLCLNRRVFSSLVSGRMREAPENPNVATLERTAHQT